MSARTLAIKGLRGIILAVAINVALYYLFFATGIFPKTFIIPEANGPLPLMPVIIAVVIPLAIATIVYALLARFTKRPNQIFWIITIGLLLLSFYPPFTIPTIPLYMAIGLNVMHVVAALSIAWSLTSPVKSQIHTA